MKLKIFYINVYYPRFIKNFYKKYPTIKHASYQHQLDAIYNESYGISNFYPLNFKKLGHTVQSVVVNAPDLQKRWAKEQKFNIFSVKDAIIPHIPLIRAKHRNRWETDILEEKIKRFQPDVIFMQNISYLDHQFVSHLKQYTRLMVGQIASRLPPKEQLAPFDLIFGSLPNLLEKIKSFGCSTQYLPLGFEKMLLNRLPSVERDINCSFIGGLAKGEHAHRTKMLNTVGSKIKLDFFGYGNKYLKPNLPLLKYHGEIGGIDMYTKLLQSKITLNSHSEISKNYANNMRLFEATGCGALLITDWKENLQNFFKIDKEIVTYKTFDELIKKIKYYSKNDNVREKIAKAGQKKTLTKHTYFNRVEIINKHIIKQL